MSFFRAVSGSTRSNAHNDGGTTALRSNDALWSRREALIDATSPSRPLGDVPLATFVVLSLAAFASAAPADFKKQNALDAQALNAKFASLTADDACTDGEQACVQGGFAQCVGGKFQVSQCAGDSQCFVLPLANKAGTSITCDTPEDAAARFTTAGVDGGVDGQGCYHWYHWHYWQR
ncbi:hypothetical protein C8Q74DRAFT_1037153 [Fomes fomentarius]|nr:hypothetical protein C8Q74DRAFT_1037153 [Fomes fomentarius]